MANIEPEKNKVSGENKVFLLDDILNKGPVPLTVEQIGSVLDQIKTRLGAHEALKYEHNTLGQKNKQLEKKYGQLEENYSLLEDDNSFKNIVYRDALKQVDALKEKLKEVKEQSLCDGGLTKLYNKLCFDKTMKTYAESNKPFSLIVFDVDKFKQINDCYGHSSGDGILKAVASFVRANIEKSDIPFRYGGDEFVIVCPYTSESQAATIADRLCKSVKSEVGVSLSMGVCQSNPENKLPIFDRADRNMYVAKDLGTDCYVTDSFAKTL